MVRVSRDSSPRLKAGAPSRQNDGNTPDSGGMSDGSCFQQPASATAFNTSDSGTTSWLACSLHAGPYTPSSGRSPLSSYPSSRAQRRIATGGLPHMSKFSPFQQPAAQPSRRANGSHCSAMSFGSYGNGCLVSLKVSTPLSAVICVRGSKVFFQPACFHREVGNHQYS